MPTSFSCPRVSSDDIFTVASDSDLVMTSASKWLPANPSIPENVLPHDLHRYRCTGLFLLHLRLPLRTTFSDGHLGVLHRIFCHSILIFFLRLFFHHSISKSLRITNMCRQIILPPALASHWHIRPRELRVTTYHRSCTVCYDTFHPIEIRAIVAPAMPANSWPFFLMRSICSLDRLFLPGFGLVPLSFVFETVFFAILSLTNWIIRISV